MAKKSLSGKRWFYAAGARAASQGKSMWLGQDRQQWPQWAKDAYAYGWTDQYSGDWRATQATKLGGVK